MLVSLGGANISVTTTREIVAARITFIKSVRAGFVSECIEEDAICVAQGGYETLKFEGVDGSDFSGATQITFDVWESFEGASVISKTLTGGDITIGADNSFQLDLTSAETLAMAPTVKYYEAWVTTSGDRKYPVSKGTFTVEDTRKQDA